MTIREQLHNSETHKPGSDPACPQCVSETPEAIAEREYQSEIEAQPRYHDGAPAPSVVEPLSHCTLAACQDRER